MGRHAPRNRATATVLALGLLTSLAIPSHRAMAGPILWGYGIKGCPDYLRVAPAAGAETVANEEYLRYREWLAGLVTGLNLATGLDVLKGAELEAALSRIRARCEEHPEDDFFNASLALLKSLGTVAGEKRE